jgi:hypothetical protein
MKAMIVDDLIITAMAVGGVIEVLNWVKEL